MTAHPPRHEKRFSRYQLRSPCEFRRFRRQIRTSRQSLPRPFPVRIAAWLTARHYDTPTHRYPRVNVAQASVMATIARSFRVCLWRLKAPPRRKSARSLARPAQSLSAWPLRASRDHHWAQPNAPILSGQLDVFAVRAIHLKTDLTCTCTRPQEVTEHRFRTNSTRWEAAGTVGSRLSDHFTVGQLLANDSAKM